MSCSNCQLHNLDFLLKPLELCPITMGSGQPIITYLELNKFRHLNYHQWVTLPLKNGDIAQDSTSAGEMSFSEWVCYTSCSR